MGNAAREDAADAAQCEVLGRPELARVLKKEDSNFRASPWTRLAVSTPINERLQKV